MAADLEIDMSPAEFLAASEVAITDRTPDPLESRQYPTARRGQVSRRAPSSALESPLSARAFKHLRDEAAATLSACGIAGVFGWTTGSRRNPGPTWISLTSPRAYGRLVRNSDGSSQSSAYRTSDGRALLVEQNETTTAAHFDDLVRSMSRPQNLRTPR
jgi:hypothetical protein